MMRFVWFRNLLLVAVLLSFSSELYAQGNARIVGSVTEQGSGEPLTGANVVIKGTTIGASVDINGNFVINGVRPGTHIVSVTYVGFRNLEREIIIVARQTLELNIELEWQGVVGEDLVITAQARGQMTAINQQRASNTITNIVSSDRIQELPDVNAAESIGRLPGVAIQRSGGEANKIAIRGLSPKFNSVTVNGVRMPSVDTNDRSVDLSLVSSNMLDGIEVTKALTPDKDADAIGGTVDLRLRTAPERLFLDLQLQGGYTALQQSANNYKIVGTSGRRFFENKLGLIVGFNIDSFDRSADQFSGGYEIIPNPQNNNEPTPNVTSLNLRENTNQRSRIGGNALIDYDFWKGKAVFNTFYNFLGNDGSRRVNEFNISNNIHKYSFSNFKGDAAIFTTSFNVEQDFTLFQIDAGVSYTSSFNEHPQDFYWDFMEESAFDGARLDEIRFQAPQDIPPVFRNNKDNTAFNYMNIRTSETSESEISAVLNAKVPFRLGINVDGYVKVGGKVRQLTRSHDVEQIGAGLFYGGGQELRNIIATELPELGLTTGMNRFPIEYFEDNYTRSNFLNGDYPIGYTLRKDYLRQVSEISRPYMLYDMQASLSNDYEGFEEYFAGYLMTEINIGKYLTFMPGFRYETEYTKYDAKFTRGTQDRPLDADGRPENVVFRDTSATRTGEHFLPMLHLQIKPTEWLNLRLAYTHSLARPSFREYAPITFISQYNDWASAPNTRLKTSTAVNYDASLSIYRNKIGFFTVSLFYKEISDLVWGVNFPLLADQTILPDLVLPGITGVPRIGTSLNNEYLATVKGVEFDWQTSFWYLPSFMKGLVLSVNLTMMESETKYPTFTREQIPITPRPRRPPFTTDVIIDTFFVARMPDQPSEIVNITLGYDYKGFSTRLSYLYQSDILRGINADPQRRSYTADYYRFDLSIRQKLPYNLQVMANFNNLNNMSDEQYQSAVGAYPTFVENYGFTMDIGVRYTFK